MFEDAKTAFELQKVLVNSPRSYSIEFQGRTYYRPWVGYFEHLNDLDVLIVRKA